MRRRSKAGGEPAKTRRRKTATRKRRDVPKAVARRSSFTAGQETDVARLTRELNEALEQQTATSKVLQVISSSPGDLQPVFAAMLENAVRICHANFGNIFRWDGNALHLVATHNTPSAFVEARRQSLLRPDPKSALGRMVATKTAIHVADLAAEVETSPSVATAVELGGIRTILLVPLLKESELIGAFSIYRQEVRPFTDKQVELVTNFAAQAVIAIENTRLLNELRESLERQTATSEVLSVISSSPGELQPVFQAMLENATRICEAKFGTLLLCEGDAFRGVATHGVPTAYAEWHRRQAAIELRDHPDIPIARLARTKETVHISDLMMDRAYTERDSRIVALVESAGARSVLAVPMLKGKELFGAIVIFRQEIRPFTEKQIELVQNFAAQAVIAIENTRLLSELRLRTTDLSESLEQQTATSEVLKVIGSSPGDLQPVFSTMLESAARLCDASFGNIFRWDNDALRLVATYNTPAAFVEARSQLPLRRDQNNPIGEMLAAKAVLRVDDLAADERYTTRRDPNIIAAVELGGVRTFLAVPMLKDDELIGALIVYRQEVRPFSDKQIELVKNFAAQAVIAIENARLLSELRESLEQQTATSEVLKVIPSSPANIQPVLDIIGERAEKLCEADISVVSIVEGELIHRASIHGMTEAGVEAYRRNPMRRTDEAVTARAVRTRSICHVADVLSDPQYQRKDTARVSGVRGSLAVPMVRDEQVVGAIFVARRQPGLFSDAQVQLLKTFADQAVIAIENVRLFNETKNSLEQQTATADVLKIISRSAFDLQTVLQTLVESAARFCAADKAQIIREKNGGFCTAEAYGYSREFMDYIKNIPIKTERGTASGRALVEGRVVHIADVRADPEYTLVEASRLGDFRTALSVPMLREGIPVGVLTLTRSEVQPFTAKQIELVTTFADQAAIAIENVRLFDEIQDKSRQSLRACHRATATAAA